MHCIILEILIFSGTTWELPASRPLNGFRPLDLEMGIRSQMLQEYKTNGGAHGKRETKGEKYTKETEDLRRCKDQLTRTDPKTWPEKDLPPKLKWHLWARRVHESLGSNPQSSGSVTSRRHCLWSQRLSRLKISGQSDSFLRISTPLILSRVSSMECAYSRSISTHEPSLQCIASLSFRPHLTMGQSSTGSAEHHVPVATLPQQGSEIFSGKTKMFLCKIVKSSRWLW